jgi:predicted acylesterase/phospholipase RssA
MGRISRLVGISLLSTIFSSHIAFASQDVCHALALSGGANKGAYEAGVIWGLVNALTPEEVRWDVVTGVSAGAMNAAGMSIFEVGNEVAMSEFLL